MVLNIEACDMKRGDILHLKDGREVELVRVVKYAEDFPEHAHMVDKTTAIWEDERGEYAQLSLKNNTKVTVEDRDKKAKKAKKKSQKVNFKKGA